MTFKARVFALDSKKFEQNFLNSGKPASAASAPTICDDILALAIKQCQIIDWACELVGPIKGELKDSCGIGSDLEVLQAGLEFIEQIQGVRPSVLENQPWWISGVRQQVKVVLASPAQLEEFTNNLHDKKFLEVVLSNLRLGDNARRMAELCQFLDNAQRHKAWLLTLAW